MEREESSGSRLASALVGLLATEAPPPRNELDMEIPAVEELTPPLPQSEFPERWSAEVRFFDEMAEKLATRLRPLDPRTVVRYHEPRNHWSSKEFRFHLLGNLRGKHVLDAGCGEGSSAVLMAKFGAHVTGVDISPGSIEMCKHRARLDNVEAQTRFVCSPLETVELPDEAFDIIWGDGILHHVIPELDPVMRHLLRWARPGALFVFSEPVSLTPWLRKLRKGLSVPMDSTPDERPLEQAELSIILRHLPGLELKWFRLLSRLDRFILPDHNYECSSLPRRLATNMLGRMDELLLSVPRLQPLGGICVLSGRKPGQR